MGLPGIDPDDCGTAGITDLEVILRAAAQNSSYVPLERLLSTGADPNATLRNRTRPLHLAILLNDPDATDALLRHGAEIQFADLILISALATSADDLPDSERSGFDRILQLVQSKYGRK